MTLAENFYADTFPAYQTSNPPLDDAAVNYHLITVKFRENNEVRLRNRTLTSLAGTSLSAVQTVLNNPQIADVRRLFNRSEATLDQAHQTLQAQNNTQVADLNSYYLVTLKPNTSDAEAKQLIDQLNQQATVETAYPQPKYYLAGGVDIAPTTPLLSGSQYYMETAPYGINAREAWTQPGGKGDTVKVVDIEFGWQTTHEDLNIQRIEGPAAFDTNHGTAVAGEIVGIDNGYGVSGISPNATMRGISVGDGIDPDSLPVSTAIDDAVANTSPGDVILVELHAPGPQSGSVPPGNCNPQQYGFIAMEYWQDIFDAVQYATASGRIVIEAAGNGSVNLDDPHYNVYYRGRIGNAFNRAFRDSGAILVGASYFLVPTCFTNFGSRVDLQGQGEAVVSTGYGDFFDGSPFDDPDQYYTSEFAGTSSASPIVVGAAVDLQGMAKARGTLLTPAQVLQFLKDTGTQQLSGTQNTHIGPLPNLLAAMNKLPKPASCNPEASVIRASPAYNGAQENDGTGGYWAMPPTVSIATSNNGRFVAFQSLASNLVVGDTNNQEDVFVYDRQTCRTRLVSVDENGIPLTNASGYPSISNDGRYVAFFTHNNSDSPVIYRYDNQLGGSEKVTIAYDGFNDPDSGTYAPALSGDGFSVAFQSNANNLIDGSTTGHLFDVFMRNILYSQTSIVSLDSQGSPPASGLGGNAQYDATQSVSQDGTAVAFIAYVPLVQEDTNSNEDVYVRDSITNKTELISVDSLGNPANEDSSQPSISGDGRYFAFTSHASNLVDNDTNGKSDIFVHDRVSGKTERVSVSTFGDEGDKDSYYPSISSDGRYITFTSEADNLVDNDANGTPDIFVHDRVTNQTISVSLAVNGGVGNSTSSMSAISPDGKYVTFYSFATNLVGAGNTPNCPNPTATYPNGCSSAYLVRVSFPPPSPPNSAPVRNYFTTGTPTLTWGRVTWAVTYKLQIADNANFMGATTYTVGDTLAFTPPSPLNSGTYYWRVQACTSATACKAWSAKDSFVVKTQG